MLLQVVAVQSQKELISGTGSVRAAGGHALLEFIVGALVGTQR